jgi:hypothetical protein
MLTRRGVGFLVIGLGVALLIPVLAFTYVMARHLLGAPTWRFGLLVLAAVLLIAELVRAIRSVGYA